MQQELELIKNPCDLSVRRYLNLSHGSGKILLPVEGIQAMAGVLGRGRFEALLHRCSCSSYRSLSGVLDRPFIICSGSRRMSSKANTQAAEAETVRKQLEAAARENRLDFLTAARILFSTPPKPKTFGKRGIFVGMDRSGFLLVGTFARLDFHLWQFFVALLPPFAVYLTAQYSRYEIRRMEKERDDKEELERQAVLAKELAARMADEESKVTPPLVTLIPQRDSSATQQGQQGDSYLKNKDKPLVMLPEKDFLAMKARLDAMEDKVRLLESVRPGTTFIIPLESEANPQRVSTKEDTQNPDAQEATRAQGGEDRQRKIEKQKLESSLEMQNQKDVQVSQVSGRSWFGIRSKPKEKELPE